MANENKDIGDIVKKCKILLLDIEGTTTSISFVKDKLFPYAEENVKQFLESEWESKDVKEAVTALRKLALEDKEKSVEGLIAIPGEDATKEEQIEGLVNNVKWQMSSDRKVGALKQLQGLIWKQGYDKGDIKGHVYDDVSSALENWQSVDEQKIYIYSSGSVQAQKLLFGQSLAGDLLKFIDGHFDTAVGAKQESTSYTSIVEKVGCKPEEILFLTDIVKEAEAARTAGLHAALVSREGNAPLTSEATDSFAVIHSFAQLSVSNKRKTEPQNEQPAKVAKTDVSTDVKTETESAPKDTPAEKDTPKEEPEKMEVEEVTQPLKEEVKEKKTEECISKVEVTKSESIEAPAAATKPAVTEVVESKVEKSVAEETMETDSGENEKVIVKDTPKQDETIITEPINEAKDESKSIETENKTESKNSVPKENIEVTKQENATDAEKTTTTITEIEEINDKENLSEMAEIIEDLQPIVEEPNENEDIEALQNVGEVLEKECDEILSKVQDVTNLDIPIKPILNPIVEESMETENTDSNDIVDSILETEIELEKKQQDNLNEKTVQANEATNEVATVTSDKDKEKTGITEEKTDKDDTVKAEIKEDKTSITEINNVSEEKVLESKENVEEKADKTVLESSSQDKKPEQNNETKPVTENSPEEKATDTKVSETKESDAAVEDNSKESSTEKSQVNGKTNGETETVKQNGDAKSDDDLSSRLAVENGNDKEINGSNGDSSDAKNGQEEKKETEIIDIKVKTVPMDETRTELIEQPTEA